MLIDLQKAFVTINHEILFKYFEATGFLNQYIQCFCSYLFERIFFIEIENQLSDYEKYRVVYQKALF